jgi:hypothetical protein
MAYSCSLGLSSLIATSVRSIYCRGLPQSTTIRSRRFSRPQRLHPPRTLRVYFAPLPRPGFTLQGIPLTLSAKDYSSPTALLTFCLLPYVGPDGAGASRRLQGFDPSVSPLQVVAV